SVDCVLEFLQQLFDEGKAASTLKVYLAAISACHAGINGSSPWQSPASVTLYGGGETAQGAGETPHTLLGSASGVTCSHRASVRAPGDSGHKFCLFKDRAAAGVNVSKTRWRHASPVSQSIVPSVLDRWWFCDLMLLTHL